MKVICALGDTGLGELHLGFNPLASLGELQDIFFFSFSFYEGKILLVLALNWAGLTLTLYQGLEDIQGKFFAVTAVSAVTQAEIQKGAQWPAGKCSDLLILKGGL